jgi:hypothetical protein
MNDLDKLIASIPSDWTAFEIRSRGGRTRFVCDLSREDDLAGEEVFTGHGKTVYEAVSNAIRQLPDVIL